MTKAPDRELSRAGLSLLLASAMAIATVASPLIGVLAPYLRSELGLEPASLGLLVAAYAAVSALVSWPAGRLTDRLGGRRALILVFIGSGIALSSFALAVTYLGMMAAMVVGGLSNGAVNPATNYVIAENVDPGGRGLVAGIKMAGVQMGVFGVGLLVPMLAERVGWRLSVGVGALVVCMAGVYAVRVRIPPAATAATSRRLGFHWSRPLIVLTVYSLLVSSGANAALTYLPLFAVDELAATPAIGGLAVAVAGVFAIVGRLFWGRVTERVSAPMNLLLLVGVIAISSGVLLLTTAEAGSLTLWTGVVALGFSALSFSAVITVALLLTFPREQMGSASGVVFVGFMAGFGIGPAVFGVFVESSYGYSAGWIGVIAAFALATLLAWLAVKWGAKD